MTTALPAFAQQEVGNAPLPEVEVDGSVLQQLDPSAGNTQSLSPIQLTPPPSLARQATSTSGPTLTDTLDLDPSGEKDIAVKGEAPKEAPAIIPPPEHVVAKVIVPPDAPPTPIETQPVQSAAAELPVIHSIAPPPVAAAQPVVKQAVVEPVAPAPSVQDIAAAENITEPASIPAPVSDKADTDGEKHESFFHHYVTSPVKYITAPVKSLFGSQKAGPALAEVPAPPAPDSTPAIASASELPPEVTAATATAKAGMVSPKPANMADENRPAAIPQKKASKPVQVATAKPVTKVDMAPVAASPVPPADNNMVTEVVMEAPGIPMPTAPLQPVQQAATPAKKIVVAKTDKDLIEPPKAMAEAEGIKAPVTKAVMFPITSKSKTRGDLNPEITATSEAKTPVIPAAQKPQPAPQQIAAAAPAPKQAEPEIIYRNVPVPKPRPNVVVASRDFVEQARRTYETTYKVMKRDGDQMPAVNSAKVSKEDLAAPAAVAARKESAPVRMSVADIASDPLASKLVAMTPDDIASTLSNMAPAAGGGKPARSVEDEIAVPTQNRVRIVRENGNWVPRKPSAPTQVASADSGADTSASSLPSDGRFNIAFQPSATDLPSTSYGEIDNGIVNALRSDSNARVQILAYASAPDGKDTTAKRTSLARALSIRSYMISKGIDATRVDVRAMGQQQDAKAAPDQVQMIIVPPDAKKS